LRSHLSMLGSDRELLKRLRAQSLAGIADFSWARAAARLSQIYRDLAHSSVSKESQTNGLPV
jgi:hypothetical protein